MMFKSKANPKVSGENNHAVNLSTQTSTLLVLTIIKVLTQSSLYLAVRKAFERYHEETVWMFVYVCVRVWQSTPKSTQTHKQAVYTTNNNSVCLLCHKECRKLTN